MQIINASYQILDEINGTDVLEKIERVARTCYKSEGLIKEGSAARMVAALVKQGHEAMLEHYSFSVKFIVDRGVSHEIVRHRMASFAQESTRYCYYGKRHEIPVISPAGLNLSESEYGIWAGAMQKCEEAYLGMLEAGCKPESARSVLPNSVKTEIVMTANLRERRLFFKLRACGVTGKPHPQMLEVAVPLLEEVKTLIPVVFDDLTTN